MVRILLCIFVACSILGFVTTHSYNGAQLFDIVPETTRHCDLLYQISKSGEFYDFFNLKKVPKPTRVLVQPEGVTQLVTLLQNSGISYKVSSLEEEKFDENEVVDNMDQQNGRALNTTAYHEYDEIMEYLDVLAEKYPTRVFTRIVGKSYEGRLIKTLTITNGNGRTNKNVIVVDSGIHAREWISVAQVLYILEQLVEKFEENKDLLEDYDWLIMPIVNVDGYDYSRRVERMWRKTRKPYPTGTKMCYGADPNRNFAFKWMVKGASDYPCDEDYGGPKPYSEVEAGVLRDVLESIKNRGIFYLTLHSYGSYLLYPWGWTKDLPENWRDLDEVAQAGGKAIYDATKRTYSIGSSTNVLYEAAGASDDYALSIGFPISITMELPGSGLFGFFPATSKIDGIVKETWIGIRAMAKKVLKKYPNQKISL